MKNILLITTLFCFLNYCSSQTFKSGKITYSISKLNQKNPLSTTALDVKLDEMLEADAKSQKFTLEFNDYKSSFKLMDNIDGLDKNSLEGQIREISRNKFTSYYSFFLDKNEKKLMFEYNDGVKVESIYSILSWEITNEEKIIGNYKCFKATYNKKYISRTNKIKTRIIEAWFCPTIPFSYGPCDYYGLPGLILELTEKGTTYYAEKIELSEKEINIIFPKGKAITLEEYEKKVLSGN